MNEQKCWQKKEAPTYSSSSSNGRLLSSGKDLSEEKIGIRFLPSIAPITAATASIVVHPIATEVVLVLDGIYLGCVDCRNRHHYRPWFDTKIS